MKLALPTIAFAVMAATPILAAKEESRRAETMLRKRGVEAADPTPQNIRNLDLDKDTSSTPAHHVEHHVSSSDTKTVHHVAPQGNNINTSSVSMPPHSTWRVLLTKETYLWNVFDLKFYTSNDCSGDNIPSDGIPVDSEHYGPDHNGHEMGPNRAFDDRLDSEWGGREDENGDLWIGMEFYNATEVGCVEVLSAGAVNLPSAPAEITVQTKELMSPTWRNVATGRVECPVTPSSRCEDVFELEAAIYVLTIPLGECE